MGLRQVQYMAPVSPVLLHEAGHAPATAPLLPSALRAPSRRAAAVSGVSPEGGGGGAVTNPSRVTVQSHSVESQKECRAHRLAPTPAPTGGRTQGTGAVWEESLPRLVLPGTGWCGAAPADTARRYHRSRCSAPTLVPAVKVEEPGGADPFPAPCRPLSALVGGRAAVEAGGLAADEPEPVELGGDEGGVGDVAVQGDAERHHVNRDPHLPGVGRVHEGEEENAAEEEGHQDEDPVHLVQERVLHFELGEEEVNVG